MNMKEELNKIEEYFNNMSTEEVRRDLLCLNGVMTEKLFEKVLESVNINMSLDYDELAYDDTAFTCTTEDFIDVFHYIETFAKDKKVEIASDFPQYKIYFTYKEENFVWRLMVGQGAYCEIYRIFSSEGEAKQHVSDFIEMKVDSNLRFFKRLK